QQGRQLPLQPFLRAVAGVEAALLFVLLFPPPPAASRVTAGLHRARARPAADAEVSPLIQGVAREAALFDVPPHVLIAPIGQGADLQDAVGLVPAHLLDARPRLRV